MPQSETPTARAPVDTGHAPPLLVENLSYSFGPKRALDEVSFCMLRGHFTALLGHNGAGKTTLFSLVLRLLQPPSGSVFINGRELISTGAAALDRLGIVFQQQTLDLDLTVRQNLAYFAALHGLSRSDAQARMARELTALNMAHAIDAKVRTLSGGQRRRIEIARALLHSPRILLLDEPTVGLDIPTRRAIVDHVHALAARDGVSVLWATHLIDEVGDGDDVVILDEGRVVASGSVEDVVRRSGLATLSAAFGKVAPAAREPLP